MFPILLKLGPITLYSYGLLVAMGVLAGLSVIDKEAQRQGWNRDWMTRTAMFTFLMGLVGGRLVYAMTRLGKEDLLTILIDPHAGFVFYGGLAGSWLTIYISAKRKKLKVWSVMDAFALAICIGEGIGRFGCLLGGCCYGKACELPWAIHLANEPHIGPVHPVQAYEGLILFAFFAFLWKRRLKNKYAGQSVVMFVGGYAVIRYILEYFRGDSIRGYVIDNILTTSQAISIGMLAFAVGIHFILNRGQSDTVSPKPKR